MTRIATYLHSFRWLPLARRPTGPPRPAATPGRRAARTAVLTGAGFAAAWQVGLMVVVDTVKPEWRDPEHGHRVRQLRGAGAAAAGRPLAVVLGSSRSELGLSPVHLGLNDADAPLVYNFAQAGCGPLGELLTLHRVLDAGFEPRFVLVEVLPPVLAASRPTEQLLVPERQSLADAPRAWGYCDEPGRFARAWGSARAAPWYSLRVTVLSHWEPSLYPAGVRQDFLWKQLRAGGWMPHYDPEMPAAVRRANLTAARAEYAPYLADFRVSPGADRAYCDLIALCRVRDIRVAFFLMPESATFRAWYPPAVRDQVARYLRELSAEADGPVFDASGWIDDETAFADGHHLLGHGAERFSVRFGRECVRPWVRGEATRSGP